ncbi:ATP-binding protein [Candidatus Accumulibacter contiguus]
MLFMQPVHLHHCLKAVGIDRIGISGWTWWRRYRQLSPAYRDYFKRLLALSLLPFVDFVPLVMIDQIWALQLPIVPIALHKLAAVACGVVAVIAVPSVGAAAFCVAYGMLFGVVSLITGSEAAIGAVRLMLLFGIPYGVGVGVAGGVGFGVAFGARGSLAVAVGGVVVLGGPGVLVGAMGVATLLGLPLYPVECLVQCALYLAGGRTPARALRYSPVLFHDLSYLPLPFLARHIVGAADADTDLVSRVLEACAIAPGQRKVGGTALAELQAREIGKLIETFNFTAALSLKGRWLPGRDTDSNLLRALAEAARFLAAADSTYLPHLAQQHLNEAEQQLAATDIQRLQSREPLARFVPDTLATYRRALALLRERTAQAAAETLPNPFVTTNPISGSMHWGRQIFRGREAVVRQIEGLLGHQQNSTSLALIGPRRCGKSSLLNMFRLMLPDTQIVLFDLQDNPATTPLAFYRALAEQARVQADQDRRLQLPAFPEGPPIEALRVWLDALENFTAVPRVLICIDEFERLASLFPGQGQDLLQFMGLLRATIQHRRRVRLLVAGAAPFDELDALWNDHFINLREIRIGHLDRPTAVGLLTRPIDEFPPETIPLVVAEAAVDRTGGQPYLTQLYGSLLVDRLNDDKRRSATQADLAAVEDDVLDQAGYYFRNVWGDLGTTAQAVVLDAAQGQALPPAGVSLPALRRRQITGDNGELLVPVFGRWLRERQIDA